MTSRLARDAEVTALLLDMRGFVEGMLRGYDSYGALEEPYDAEESREIQMLLYFRERLDAVLAVNA